MGAFTWVKGKTENPVAGGWYCEVEVGGAHYHVSLRRGSSTGVHYGKRGYVWYANVRTKEKEIYRGTYRYSSVSVKRILTHAGLILV